MTAWKRSLLKASRALADASVTPKAERRRGRQARAAMVGGSTISVDVEAEAYVRTVGARLVAASSDRLPPGITPCFTLIRSRQVNGYCAEGGQIFVTTGLLAAMRSEAELAAVLAHELGHAIARHCAQDRAVNKETRRGARAVRRKLGRGLGTHFATEVGRAVVSRGLGRMQEAEADGLGVEILAAAGYDPAVMGKVLAHIASESGVHSKIERALSTHPPTAERVAEVGEHATSVAIAVGERPEEDAALRRVVAHLRRREAVRSHAPEFLRIAILGVYVVGALSWIFDWA